MELKHGKQRKIFQIHGNNQEPYIDKNPIRRINIIGKESVEILMNSRLTPKGNVSRRISFNRDGDWYFRDDTELRNLALNSKLQMED